jgi:uncharacterized membrane protein
VLNFISTWWWAFGLFGVILFLATSIYHNHARKKKEGEVQAQFVLTIGCAFMCITIVSYSLSILASILSIFGFLHRTFHGS